MSLPIECPEPGQPITFPSGPWVDAMAACMQDPLHHGEGDVWTHTKLVCEALVARPEWARLSPEARWVTWVACLLHDVAKPETRRVEDGVVRHPRHSARGARRARRMLFDLEVPAALREQVVNLILWHQVPFFAIEQPDPEDRVAKLSLTTRCRHLAMVNRADGEGRICEDRARLAENADLFFALAEDQGCLDAPFRFESVHARFCFAQGRSASRFDAPPARPRCTVTLMAGLPGMGKDHYLARHDVGPVISLDGLRASLGAPSSGGQGRVLAAAEEEARAHLRAGRDFAWNGTNLTRETRGRLVRLFTDYRAHVRIVYVEAPRSVWLARNAAREAAVPAAALERMLERWEVPDVTEAHEVEWVTS
ncbi:MAG: AAA family ATPase [Myxococcales bacterium]|nr:AAA family ATPase [Myxococcales bacterium]